MGRPLITRGRFLACPIERALSTTPTLLAASAASDPRECLRKHRSRLHRDTALSSSVLVRPLANRTYNKSSHGRYHVTTTFVCTQKSGLVSCAARRRQQRQDDEIWLRPTLVAMFCWLSRFAALSPGHPTLASGSWLPHGQAQRKTTSVRLLDVFIFEGMAADELDERAANISWYRSHARQIR